MTGIDTNVLVRLLTRDDEEQFQKAASFFAKNDVLIPNTVILETEWVLRYLYDFASDAILDAFVRIFGLPNVKIEHPDAIAKAIDLARQGLDFADALHLAASNDCAHFATFDTDFIKKAKGLTKCKVRKP